MRVQYTRTNKNYLRRFKELSGIDIWIGAILMQNYMRKIEVGVGFNTS